MSTPAASSLATPAAAPSDGPGALWLVANARVPSPRAQTLQVLQASAALVRAGTRTTLVHARRADAPGAPEPDGSAAVGAARAAFHADIARRFALSVADVPALRAARCIDWIDRVPRALQFLPAREQELSFARSAAALIAREAAPDDFVLTRELEVAHTLRARPRTYLELHRIPEGRLRRRWLARAAAELAGVVAISGGVREDLVSLCRDYGVDLAQGASPALPRVCVAHDAFDPERFAALPSRADACAALGLDPERPVVVYTGGLMHWKGVEVLVDAAHDPRLADVQVVIAGGMDADVERVRRYAAQLGQVRVDGFQPAARVPLYLAAADVGVVPNRSRPAISARYTSPLKVFEAKAAGLPLVVSDLPSLREVLGEDEAVFVAPDDAGALAAGLLRLLADGPERARRSARMRALSAEHTWGARAARLLAWMGARSAQAAAAGGPAARAQGDVA
ncbi:MAG: glycosyltransferase family 4 protein [Planctomycetota bacterium]